MRGRAAWAVLAAPVLALVGGLAAACFAKVHGHGLPGARRARTTPGRAHEPPRAMLLPDGGPGRGLRPAGPLPGAGARPRSRRAAAAWSGFPEHALDAAARAAASSATRVTVAALVLAALVAALVAWRARRARGATAAETWGCGYGLPTARMQYTGESFAGGLTGRFGWALRPRARLERPQGFFPRRASFESHVPDTVLDAFLLPALRAVAATAERLRRLHRPQVQAQALLVGAALVALLAWRFLLW